MIFSPFGKDSGGFFTTGGLGLSFSRAGFSAQRNPRPKKRAMEMVRKMRIDAFIFDSILPPKLLKVFPFPSMEDHVNSSNLKENFNLKGKNVIFLTQWKIEVNKILNLNFEF